MPKDTFLNLPEEKQNHILELAVEEFARAGYDNFSISRLVAAAGIAKGSFYQYFKGKDDLYEYIIDEMIASHKMRIAGEHLDKLDGMNLTEFIRFIFHTLVTQFEGNRNLMKINVDFMSHKNQGLRKEIRHKYRDFEQNFYYTFIMEERSRNEIDPGVDAVVLSDMLLGYTYQLIQRAAEEGKDILQHDCIDEIVDKIEYILTNGIYKHTNPER